MPKSADGQTDRQTAFQLYIVDIYIYMVNYYSLVNYCTRCIYIIIYITFSCNINYSFKARLGATQLLSLLTCMHGISTSSHDFHCSQTGSKALSFLLNLKTASCLAISSRVNNITLDVIYMH